MWKLGSGLMRALPVGRFIDRSLNMHLFDQILIGQSLVSFISRKALLDALCSVAGGAYADHCVCLSDGLYIVRNDI